MTLGEQIRHAREQKNLSQDELAFQLGVSRQAVSKWENGSSLPKGINKAMLIDILEIACEEQTQPDSKKRRLTEWLGWVVATILAIVLIIVIICIPKTKEAAGKIADDKSRTDSDFGREMENETLQPPCIKRITFYDSHQEEVVAEALWYDSSRIESILIQWEGDAPETIKIMSIPSGSDTMSETELLLTQPISDGDSVILLSGKTLKNREMSHVYFQLDYGEKSISSEYYNIDNFSLWN